MNKVSKNNHYTITKPAYISMAWNAIYPPTTDLICNNSLLRKCEIGDNWLAYFFTQIRLDWQIWPQ